MSARDLAIAAGEHVLPDPNKELVPIDRMRRDAQQIKLWMAGRPDSQRVVLLVTHRDTDPRFRRMSRATYHDLLLSQLASVINALGGPSRVEALPAGSLIIPDEAKEIAENLLRALRRQP
ncbi:MAG: hypothetical protein M3460_17935 [Actinomycetota bacterium]|nr:hypothetical protein [Actinomycetota bacterium]